jgi:hypothetical protein
MRRLVAYALCIVGGIASMALADALHITALGGYALLPAGILIVNLVAVPLTASAEPVYRGRPRSSRRH